MNNREKVIYYLKNTENNICDDCLSRVLNIKPRQQINQICNGLAKKELLIRNKSICKICGTNKIINSYVFDKTSIQYTIIKERKIDIKTEQPFKILDLEEIYIDFIEVNIENIFSKYDKYLLKEVISKPKFNKLKAYIIENYSNYLNEKLNDFLMELKRKNILDYKLFLNPYGDLKYCKFKIDDRKLANSKGIYCYKVNNEIVYIGRCLDNFANRINKGYANISPKNCYLDGQSTNCRINNLINDNMDNVKLYILKMEDDKLIKKVEIELIKKCKPKWNIQGI